MDDDRMDRSVGDGQADDDLLDLPLDGSNEAEQELAEGGVSWTPGARQTIPRDQARRQGGRHRGQKSRPWWWLLVLVAFPLGGLVGYGLKAGPPIAEVAPELLDFGEVRVGASIELPIEMTSRGETALEITSITIEGAEGRDFGVLANECADRKMPRGERCELTVVFAPTEAGQRRGRLLMMSNVLAEPLVTPLRGVGTAPELRAEPAKLDFLERKIGQASAPARFWLASTGTAAATVESLRVTGPAAADFVLASDTCSGSTLPPGERCVLEVLFIPRAVGQRRATIVAVGESRNAAIEGELLGHGLELRSDLRMDLDHLEFGELPIGAEGRTESVVLSSAGDGVLEIGRISIAGDGGFQVVAEKCGSLAPSKQCRVDVRFAPVTEGEARATLEIRHNGAAGVARVLLTGTGTKARLALDPAQISFGEAQIGHVSSSRLLKVANAGSGELEVRSPKIEGADSGVFRISRETCGAKRLRGAERCSVEIEFKPRRRGPHRAELVIQSDGESRRVVAALNGLGVESQLEILPGRLEMGEVELGKSAVKEVRLSNLGRAPLAVQRVSLHGASASDFDIVSDRCSGARLESARTCDVGIRFEPSSVGLRSVQLTVDHDGKEGQRSVNVQANGLEPRRPQARVEPGRVEIEGLRVGQLSSIRTVTVSNDGTAPLTLRSIRIVGPNAADFYTVSGSCEGLTTLAAGRSCTLGVRFEPAATGQRRAEILIRHDAAGGSETVALSGEGL